LAKEQAEKYVRVKMITTKSIEISPGSFVHYRAGELYLFPEKEALKWVEKGLAVDPEAEEANS
jgi:hypothetical protein